MNQQDIISIGVDGERQFAKRMRSRDLDGIAQRSARVQEGNVALLIVDERYDQTLSPGVHQIGSWLSGLLRRGRESVVISRTGDTSVDFSLKRILTSDPYPFDIDCLVTLRFQPGKEALFLSNLMADRDQLTVDDMRSLLYSEVRDAASAWGIKNRVEELAADLSLRENLGYEMEIALNRTLDRYGLDLVSFRSTNFSSQVVAESTGLRMEIVLQATEREAELAGRKRLFEVYTNEQLQDIFEETEKVAVFEKRAQVWERMRRATLLDDFNKIQSEEDMKDFVRDVDRDRLLKESDYEKFARSLEESKEDDDRLRARVVRITELEQDSEFNLREVAARRELSQEELEGEIGLERLRVEGRLTTELRRVDLQLEQQQHVKEFQRSQSEADAALEREQQLAQALSQAQISGIELDVQKNEADLKIAQEETRRANDRKDLLESLSIETNRKNEELDIDIRREQSEQDRQLEKLREMHKQELERSESLDGLSIHALIAVTDVGKAPILADLAKTEAMKGLTPDQILAMAAGDNPELGKAVAEMAANARSPQEREMYERLISEQRDSQSRSREDFRDMTRTQQEMFNKALESQSDIAKAFAQGMGQMGSNQPAQPIVPIAQQAGGVVQPAQPTAERLVVCRNCHHDSPAGTKFCPECGSGMTGIG